MSPEEIAKKIEAAEQALQGKDYEVCLVGNPTCLDRSQERRSRQRNLCICEPRKDRKSCSERLATIMKFRPTTPLKEF